MELQRHDLLEISHRVLDRRAPFPADIRNECFVFDDMPHAALIPFKKRATVQASILGEEGGAADVERMVWAVAETASEAFGTIVEDDTMDDPELGAYFENKGVVRFDNIETFVERVPQSTLDQWEWQAGGAG